jgi:nicotinate-nucleotide adenylyltransferase
VSTGIFGGVFDPPHNGHVALARAAIDHFGLDRLLVLVADRPGHKGVVLEGPTRLELARAAFGDLPGAAVTLDGHAYTVDLVDDGTYHDAWFIVGADELVEFATWKEPQRVLDEIRLAVGTRPGYPRALLENAIAALGRPDRIELFDLPEPVAATSTEIREHAGRGEPIEDLVPPAVARLIAERGLYRPSAKLH